jgi:WD40 repeat protein
MPDYSNRPPAQIITFYSYKGGTGRSMLMANVAWVLASNGMRVLAIDWDLEAPGLHRYFYPFLPDPDLTKSEGVIDFVWDFAQEAMTPPSKAQEASAPSSEPWYARRANILRYAATLNYKFEGGGLIDFIPAGRQGPLYAPRVNAFNWANFYDRLGGGAFLNLARQRMRVDYEYVLIDSRTGVSDTAGVCTVQMPDSLVMCFTLNNQSIDGASAIAESVIKQRRQAEQSGAPFMIYPVPTRVDDKEKEKLDAARASARQRFAPLLDHVAEQDRDAYWGDVEIPYKGYYAFEEVLATFGDKRGNPTDLLAAVERITARITQGKFSALIPPTETQRLSILNQFLRRPSIAAPESLVEQAEAVFTKLPTQQQDLARRVLPRFVRLAGPEDRADTCASVSERDLPRQSMAVLAAFRDAGVIEVQTEDGEQKWSLKSDVIVREWGKLRTWVEEDRVFLQRRQELRRLMHEWEKGGRSERLLLNIRQLQPTALHLKSRIADLSDGERQYVADGIKALQRRTVLVGAAAVALLAVVGAVWAMASRGSNEQAVYLRELVGRLEREGAQARAELSAQSASLARERTEGRSREVAAAAAGKIDSDLNLATLLSAEAVKIAPTTRAVALLKQCLERPTPPVHVRLHADAVTDLALSDDQHSLVSVSGDGTTCVLSLTDFLVTQPLKYERPVTCCAISADGKRVTTGNEDGAVLVWDVIARTSTTCPSPFTEWGVDDVTFTRDGQAVVARSENLIRVWHQEGESFKLAQWFPHNAAPTTQPAAGVNVPQPLARRVDAAAAQVAGERRVVAPALQTGSGSGKNALSDAVDQSPAARSSSAFSADGRRVAVIDDSAVATVIDRDASPPRIRAIKEEGSIRLLEFSPDGSRFASTGFRGGTVSVWDAQESARIRVFPQTAAVQLLQFNDDGKTLLIASDADVRVVEVAQDRVRAPLTRDFMKAALSPDGAFAATTSPDPDGTIVQVWAVDGHKVAPPLKLPTVVVSLLFTRDNSWLIAGGNDGGVDLWRFSERPMDASELPTEQLLAQAQRRANRQLNPDERIRYGLDPSTRQLTQPP